MGAAGQALPYRLRSNENRHAWRRDGGRGDVVQVDQSYSGLIDVGGISTSCSVVSMRKLLMLV